MDFTEIGRSLDSIQSCGTSKIFDYRCVIPLLPKPDTETISRPVYLGQLSANQRVFVCVCLPVTANEMFNLQIYWLNQAIVTLLLTYCPCHNYHTSLSVTTITANEPKMLRVYLFEQNNYGQLSIIMFLKAGKIFLSCLFETQLTDKQSLVPYKKKA
jgi:hypothetical protein